jgi:Dolichyl-phosphate-mannose-protein mannosyltransferase
VSRVAVLLFHYLAALFSLPVVGLLTAATSSMVALLSLRLGATTKGARLAAVSFATATVALAYGRAFYAEALLAFLTVSALYFALGRSRSDVVLASCFAGLAILAKPTGIVIGPVLAAYLLVRRTPLFRTLLPLAGVGIGFTIFATYNVLRFGRPLNFGISSPFRMASFFPGIAGLLASSGYGLAWYSPPVILAIFGFRKAMRDKKFEALAIAAVFAAFLFLHSLLWYWYAAWSWGPSYFSAQNAAF